MKTIEELVDEVAKNLGAGKTAPKQQNKPPVFVSNPVKQEEKTGENISVTEKINPHMTLGLAKEIAKAVEIAAGIIGVKVVISVCDKSANLVLLHAMDDSLIASIKASQDKAYTAAALKMPTHIALKESRGGTLDGFTNGNGILLLGGGCPLGEKEKIYGSVGVSGGTKEQDIVLAMVGAGYFKARVK